MHQEWGTMREIEMERAWPKKVIAPREKPKVAEVDHLCILVIFEYSQLHLSHIVKC